jgi:lysophospholipase L1-like esterase
MMNRREFCGRSLSALALASTGGLTLLQSGAPALAAEPFFFRDGDRVVMIGDSITEQHLHSNYVEIYTLSRFPKWNLRFRNAGIGGDTSRGGNSRTQRDILSFNPTAVTITFGMNDAGYGAVNQDRLRAYRDGLQGMFDQMKGKNIRVAVLSSSPVEKKEEGPALEGYNQTLEVFASNASDIALKNGALFVDQFHPHLSTLQKARDADPKNRINGGDVVHPGPPGQYLMAWAILKGLHAPSLVSAAEIDARRGRARSHQNCSISEVKKTATGVSFTRADEALPWWIDPAGRSILKWAPIVDELDQYTLKVTNLPAGNYNLLIDGQRAGSVSSDELAHGYNMALLTEGPIAAQSRAVNATVFAKNQYYHDRIYRGVTLNGKVPEAEKAARIEEEMKGMPAKEQAIRDALVMKPHRFELILVKV